jgi:hypothetical protein
MKFPDWAWKVGSALALPALAWGVKLEVNRAVTNNEVETLKKTVESQGAKISTLGTTLTAEQEKSKSLVRVVAGLKGDLKEARGMQTTITTNTVALGKLEAKIDAVSTNLSDIKDLLRKP